VNITRRQFAQASLAVGTLSAVVGPAALAGANDLIRKVIPSSGEKIPAIGLGTNRYGRAMTEETRAPLRAALQRFHELGASVIDTAPAYRASETVLGDLIAELGIRNDLFIATKTDKSGDHDESKSQMKDSARKLKTEIFDLMQVHNVRGWQQMLPVMREWQQDGRIRYIGITTSRQHQYEELEKAMRSEELDFIQVNYSLEQRESAERLLPLAADRGIAVMINRAFGGGRIFDKVGKQALPDWAAEFDCASWAQFLLKYAISHPAATVAIPGMTKANHVDDNLGAARGRLPSAKERMKMEAFFEAL